MASRMVSAKRSVESVATAGGSGGARSGAVEMKLGAVPVEPGLGTTEVGIERGDMPPIPDGMVHFPPMRNLMCSEVIENLRRCQNQPPRKGEIAT